MYSPINIVNIVIILNKIVATCVSTVYWVKTNIEKV